MVQILLSTYNGTKFIKPLMESLLAQDYPHIEILVRDDGSNDGTVYLLDGYAVNHSNIKVVSGANLGFVRSFFKLLELSSPNADYVALCDQDDVWQKDKVSRAVELLSYNSREVPVLYCSRLAVADENLKPLGHTDIPIRGLSFNNALVECPPGLGCTILLNQTARRLLRRFPERAYSHDWWLYLVLSGLGTIIYDEEPRILYRNHASNVFGIPSGAKNTWRTKIHRFLENGNTQPVMNQAVEFMRIYGSSLPEEKKKVLERFLKSRKGFWHRLGYVLSCEVYRQSPLDNLVLKALIVLNRL